MDNSSKLKYFIYARKSQEGEEKQVQSIPDQIREDENVAKRHGVRVIAKLTEEGSAKEPGKRPIFDDMLQRIEKGEANGIICWNLNRLSRNPVESGRLQWLLQEGKIQSILTPNREYRPNDNAIIFSVESGTANQYIIDLKEGVRRGINSKLQKGMAPISAPLGYLNTKHENRGENYIIPDPERFPLIRKAWEMMLTGLYTPPQILIVLNDDWGLKTRKTKKRGNKSISRSTIYRIFTDPFYAGLFRYKEQLYKGNHESMISLDEFDRVQTLMGREGRPRAREHVFTYTGSIICGVCRSAITGTEKTKVIKKTGILKTYVMYHCTRRKKGGENCNQRRYIPLDDLEKMILAELTKYSISSELRGWALEVIRGDHDKETEERTKIYETQLKALEGAQRELDNLTSLRIRDLIDDSEYIGRKKELQDKVVVLKQRVLETENRAKEWLYYTEQVFEFSHKVKERFENGTVEEKKAIFLALGWNYNIIDQKLFLSANRWLEPIVKGKDSIESKITWLELEENLTGVGKREAFASLSPYLRGGRDSNPQPPT